MAIPRRPRILLADDHHLFRDAMRKVPVQVVLTPDVALLGAASCVAD